MVDVNIKRIEDSVTNIGDLQICIETGNDSETGYRMMGYKDGAGDTYKLLAKNKPAYLQSLNVSDFSTAGLVRTDATGNVLGDVNTIGELNTALGGTSIDVSTDPRPPDVHASDHTDGTDDIQDATVSQKGIMTAAQAAQLIQNTADIASVSANGIQENFVNSVNSSDDPIADVDVNTEGFNRGSTLAGSSQFVTDKYYAAKILQTIEGDSVSSKDRVAFNSKYRFMRTGTVLNKINKYTGEIVGQVTGLASLQQGLLCCNEDVVAISSDNTGITATARIYNISDMTQRFTISFATSNSKYMDMNDTELFVSCTVGMRVFDLTATTNFASNANTRSATLAGKGNVACDNDYLYLSYGDAEYCYDVATLSLDNSVALVGCVNNTVDSDGSVHVVYGTSIRKYTSRLASVLYTVDTSITATTNGGKDYLNTDGLKLWRTYYSGSKAYNYQYALNVIASENVGGAHHIDAAAKTAWAVTGSDVPATPEEIRAASDKAISTDGSIDGDGTTEQPLSITKNNIQVVSATDEVLEDGATIVAVDTATAAATVYFYVTVAQIADYIKFKIVDIGGAADVFPIVIRKQSTTVDLFEIDIAGGGGEIFGDGTLLRSYDFYEV